MNVWRARLGRSINCSEIPDLIYKAIWKVISASSDMCSLHWVHKMNVNKGCPHVSALELSGVLWWNFILDVTKKCRIIPIFIRINIMEAQFYSKCRSQKMKRIWNLCILRYGSHPSASLKWQHFYCFSFFCSETQTENILAKEDLIKQAYMKKHHSGDHNKNTSRNWL